MNYAAHYERLMKRAPNTKPTHYSERHHIIPKCIGGTNDRSNLVYLTPEEHYVAHQLLVKMHPGNRKLIYAAKMMTTNLRGHRNNKMFGWLKREWVAALKTDSARNEKIRISHIGLTKSENHRRNLSLSHIGKKKSKEHIEKIKQARANQTMTCRPGVSKRFTGSIWVTDGNVNRRLRIGELTPTGFRIGRMKNKAISKARGTKRGPPSKETARKIGLAQLGEKNHTYGKIWITNGIKSLFHDPKQLMPEGFIKGRHHSVR